MIPAAAGVYGVPAAELARLVDDTLKAHGISPREIACIASLDSKQDDPALRDLAIIVRGADTGHPELSPQSPGLLAVSLGLSRVFSDDHEMLRHGMVVYDALYAWCREARGETHGWPPT